MKHLSVILLSLILGLTLASANAKAANDNNSNFSFAKKIEKNVITDCNNINTNYYNSGYSKLEHSSNSDCLEVHFSCGPVAYICGYEGDLSTLIEALLIVDDIICP